MSVLFAIVLCGKSRKADGMCRKLLVQRCINSNVIALAIYARTASAKLAVGSTTPSLCRYDSDADIRHYCTAIYAT